MTRPDLVTGAAGFTGRHLGERLRADGAGTLVGADRFPAADGSPYDELAGVDLADAEAVDALVARVRPGRVFHLAGVVAGDAAAVLAANVLPAAHLLDAVRRHAPDARVLVVGSAAEYGAVPDARQPVSEAEPCEPLTPYGIAKHAVARLAVGAARLHGLRATVARPFNLVGAGVPPTLVAGAVVARLRAALADAPEGAPLELRVGNVHTERDFVDVGDAVDLYVRLLDAGPAPWGEAFNVCSGAGTSIASLVSTLAGFTGREVRLVADPALARATDVRVMVGSPARLAALVGPSAATPLEESLRAAWLHAAAGRPPSPAPSRQ